MQSERVDDRVQVVEARVRDALRIEVARKRAGREDTVGGERCATIGEAVADVDELALGQRPALARLAAGLADRLVAPAHDPALLQLVGDELEVGEALAFEDWLDQLPYVRREEER